MRKKPAMKVGCYFIVLILPAWFCSCVGGSPETLATKTPPVYFTPPPVVPVIDSHYLHTGVTHGQGMAMNVWGYYRFKKNIVAGGSYNSNGTDPYYGRHYDGPFDYYNRTKTTELFGGYIHNISPHASLYGLGGWGSGSSVSTVIDYDGITRFPYVGDYTKWFGLAGITFYTAPNKRKAAAFGLGYRGSWVNFSTYSPNGERYSDVGDFLSDVSLNVSIPVEFVVFRICINSHWNGHGPGDRLYDNLFREWRRYKTNICIGAGFRLFKEK